MSVSRAVIVSPKRYEGPIDADGFGITIRVNVNYKKFAAASTTGNYDITNFPGGVILEEAFLFLRTNFTGGGAGTATISVGSTGAATSYVLATSVFSGAPKAIGAVVAEKGTLMALPNTNFVNASTPTAAGTIRVQLVADVNTNLLTAGNADLFLKLRAVSART